MEFSSRGFQRGGGRPTSATTQGALADSPSPVDPKKPAHKRAVHKIRSNTVLSVVFFLSALVLIVAVILGISTKSSENSIVQKNRYQAVFLSGGQAYFGKIKALNERYIDLRDIYYVSTNGQSGENSQPNISLVKLGSELHCPQDRMVINRDQVLFWENLNDDGKVVNAIKQWQKENPNGQKCNNQSTRQQSSDQSQTPNESQATTPTDSTGQSSDAGGSSSDTPTTNTPKNNTPDTSTGADAANPTTNPTGSTSPATP